MTAPSAGGLRVTLLGTGTSTGVPRIACDCPVCTSDDPRNKRLRAGVLLEGPGGSLLVDTSPDLRQQALTHDLRRLDAVLFTHSHADHIYGLDDVRVFNFIQRREMPCFGSPATLRAIRRYFAYVFEAGQAGGGKPLLALRPVTGPFEAAGERVVPVPAWHGEMPVYGYRVRDFALVTDVSAIPETSLELLAGLDVLVLGALRYTPHPTHFNFDEAVEMAGRIAARRTVFTHISHEVDHAAPKVALPDGVEIGYDGQVFELP
jgi:phosphoribosyl 1,2-cyclic phosphate phosphodiesterase